MKITPIFATEVDLCTAFLAKLEKGWIPYAETEGWDILLVRTSDGAQVGIEAKLKLNLNVLIQSLEGDTNLGSVVGPDYRAVLIPDGAEVAGVRFVAERFGVTVISVSAPDGYRKGRYAPDLPNLDNLYGSVWHEWLPPKRHTLPEYVPDVPAGASAPMQLSRWKIGALKIVAVLETRGVVTRADFKALGVDPRRWTDRWTKWLQPTAAGYIAGPGIPDFKNHHPAAYAAVLADASKWMPPVAAPSLFGPTA